MTTNEWLYIIGTFVLVIGIAVFLAKIGGIYNSGYDNGYNDGYGQGYYNGHYIGRCGGEEDGSD